MGYCILTVYILAINASLEELQLLRMTLITVCYMSTHRAVSLQMANHTAYISYMFKTYVMFVNT